MSFRLLIVILILLAIDFYVFQGIKTVMKSSSIHSQKISTAVYWSISLLCISIIHLGFFTDWHSWNKIIRTYSFAIIVVIYLSKIFVIPFLLIDDVLRL